MSVLPAHARLRQRAVPRPVVITIPLMMLTQLDDLDVHVAPQRVRAIVRSSNEQRPGAAKGIQHQSASTHLDQRSRGAGGGGVRRRRPEQRFGFALGTRPRRGARAHACPALHITQAISTSIEVGPKYLLCGSAYRWMGCMHRWKACSQSVQRTARFEGGRQAGIPSIPAQAQGVCLPQREPWRPQPAGSSCFTH